MSVAESAIFVIQALFFIQNGGFMRGCADLRVHFLIISSVLLSIFSPSQAQAGVDEVGPAPLKAVKAEAIDRFGVDLIRGNLSPPSLGYNIGASGSGLADSGGGAGQVHAAQYTGGVVPARSLYPSKSLRALPGLTLENTLLVTLGSYSGEFFKANGVYTSSESDGASLEITSQGLLLTLPDGTKGYYDKSILGDRGVYAVWGALVKIEKPDGEVIDINYTTFVMDDVYLSGIDQRMENRASIMEGRAYANFENYYDYYMDLAQAYRTSYSYGSNFTTLLLPKTVRSSLGWMIKFKADTAPPARTLPVIKSVKFINLSQDYCDYTAANCDGLTGWYQSDWVKSDYAWVNDIPLGTDGDSWYVTNMYDRKFSQSDSLGFGSESHYFTSTVTQIGQLQTIDFDVNLNNGVVLDTTPGPCPYYGPALPAGANPGMPGFSESAHWSIVQEYWTSTPADECIKSVTTGGQVWTYTYSQPDPTSQREDLVIGDVRTTTVSNPLGGAREVRSKYLSTVIGWRVISDKDELSRTTQYEYDAYGRTNKVIRPEGDFVTYEYDDRGNLLYTRSYPKGGGTPNVAQAGYAACQSTNLKYCNKPLWVRDANGNQTDYEYSADHGGLTLVRLPADQNGMRPEIRYTYSSLVPQAKNASGALTSQAAIWRLTKISSCAAGAGASCAGTASEQVTDYAYNHANLLLTSETIRSGDSTTSATTQYEYDRFGNVIAVDGPRTEVDDKRYMTYDLRRRPIFQIGPDPDGSGPLKRQVVKHSYDAFGREDRTDAGTGAALDGSDFTWVTSRRVTYDGQARPIKTEVVTP